MPTEVLFYHLERTTLEQVLPGLLEKSLQRGWNAVVHASSEERIMMLDTLLWTYNDASFLPHGTAKDDYQAEQPVFLTTDDVNPNKAAIRFMIDGASTSDLNTYERAVFMFDGLDEQAVNHARSQWKVAKAAGCEVTYWRQSGQGRWEKQG
ncbi:MAG: DNA polymerase III subunit chi [Methyloligellaceae bacterium]